MISIKHAIKIAIVILSLLARPALPAQAEKPLYGTIGPEAPVILRALVSPEQILPIEPSQLMQTLAHTHLTMLIVPHYWFNESEFDAILATGVSVTVVARHTSIERIGQNIRILANVTHQPEVGRAWTIKMMTEQYRIMHDWFGLKQPRVLVLSPDGYTRGLDTLITQLIYISGGVNVAAEAGIHLAKKIDDEQIRAFAPDVILLINWSPDSVAHFWTPDSVVSFARKDTLSSVPAVRLHRLYRIETIYEDPVRLLAELQQLADLFHPPLL